MEIDTIFRYDNQLRNWYNKSGEEGYEKNAVWDTFNSLSDKRGSEIVTFNNLKVNLKAKLIDLAYELSQEIKALTREQIVECLMEIKVIDRTTYSMVLRMDKEELKRRILEIYSQTEWWQKNGIK